MSETTGYEVKVVSGRKAGVTHPLPLGDLTVGTTLDVDLFTGCADMWRQLLRADSSANLRSATASGDALPEQLMRVVLSQQTTGITLSVQEGFAEVGQQRLLPGDSCNVPVNKLVRVGSSEFQIQSIPIQSKEAVTALQKPDIKGYWPNRRRVSMSITALAVAALSMALLVNRPKSDRVILTEPETAETQTVEAMIFNERVVAVISSNPAFVMTEKGQQYRLGSVIDNGYQIEAIFGSTIELSRAKERIQMSF